MPIRLGIYIPCPGISGPSRYVDSLLTNLQGTGIDITIFGHSGGPYRDHPGVTLVPVEPEAPRASLAPAINSSRPNSVGRLPRGSRFLPRSFRLWAGFGRECQRLARILRANPVDLFHTQNTGCEESSAAARMAGMPRILGTFHVDPTYDLTGERSGPEYRILECFSNFSLHRAIAVSEATKGDWVRRTGIPRDQVVAIHNGIDPIVFQRRTDRCGARHSLGLPGEETRLIVGGVGRLDRAKGFSDLLEAISMLKEDYPDLNLLLAGDGPLRSELEGLAKARGIADRVHFLGFRDDVQVVYDALDVFVLPSHCEALGYAHLEAMATELPVIGTNVGGVPEVIEHGKTGFLVPPRDPAALAGSLRILLADAQLRARMGEAGRRRVIEHFNQADSVRKTIEVYREMLRPVTARAGRRGTEWVPGVGPR